MQKGKLIVCGNHSGNLADIPSRTIDTIKLSKYIYCDYLDVLEPTILIPHKIDTKDKIITETGGVNQVEIAKNILEVLGSGNNVALITDTGLPGFGDQGTFVIKEVYDNGFEVEIIPGPTIISLAVVAAGIPASGDMVVGLDFFNIETKNIDSYIHQVKDLDAIIVILCHPYEIDKVLSKLIDSLNHNRLISLCIDIGLETQEIIRGRLDSLIGQTFSRERGHTSIVLEGSKKHFDFS
jgi:16S rRNA (cytidine1402-2'-O)-methyltransferase